MRVAPQKLILLRWPAEIQGPEPRQDSLLVNQVRDVLAAVEGREEQLWDAEALPLPSEGKCVPVHRQDTLPHHHPVLFPIYELDVEVSYGF